MSTARHLQPNGLPEQSLTTRVVSLVVSVGMAALGLWVGFAVVGQASDATVAQLLLTAVALLIAELAARPFLRRLAGRGSALLAMVVGLVGQLVIAALVVWAVFDVRIEDWYTIAIVLVVMALFTAVGRWLVGASDTAYIIGHAMRRRPSRGTSSRDVPAKGLVVLQFDGVSAAVMRRAMASGQAPTVMRWLSRETHVMRDWWVPVPSTTPASQAGILHGDDTQVPGFRWWDRRLGRLMVSNRSADAAIVETRFPAGHGLLRDGGVAISTAFTGEADDAFLVFSRAGKRGGLGSGASYIPLFASPFLLPRTLLLTFGEMVKELYQARRQRVRRVEPRIPRELSYVALRGITNVFLRTLNLVLVADSMCRGAPIIFVDFVDYDEIAHHAGPERPEAMRALEGMDAVLGELAQAEGRVATDYDFVIWSDHGQSLGATFEQVVGATLTERVKALMAGDAVSTLESADGDDWGPLNALLTSTFTRSDGSSRPVELGPDRAPDGADDKLPDVVVVGGGNLGMVWFPGLSTRPTLEQVTERWPGLVPGLALTEGVGAVMVADDTGGVAGAMVVGPSGVHRLESGEVDGLDPLLPYGPRAADDLRRLSTMEHCGDLVLLSTVGADGSVHAFEGLVGSHGGLGGWQNNGLLIHPAHLEVDADLMTADGEDRIFTSPVAVHDQIERWRRAQGTLGDDS
ncbi:MAG: alkaline phosphatase family protein [Humibacillus sp.]|nr:alkaline phosphatase family protein [Humibacillus sp.]MDN5779849.1 alkaline phosphatase family protein [Humibacillus sp.]